MPESRNPVVPDSRLSTSHCPLPAAHSPEVFSFTSPKSGARLDQFLALQFPAVSTTKIRNVIKAGQAQVNGKKTFPGWILQAGDQVSIQLDAGEPTSSLPENIPLEILFEDPDLLIINKQVGLLSHPSSSEKSGTLMNAIAWHLLHHSTIQSAKRPILLHRLDRDTSGVIAIALNERAARIVNKAFRLRRVTKRYLALVHGAVPHEGGEIDAPIGREAHGWPRWRVKEGGDPSQTRYTVSERFTHHTLLELEPLTGRTHQLRIHCAHLGHPIIGDTVYKGSADISKSVIAVPGLKSQLLHAHLLTFIHPSTGEKMTFTAPLNSIMRETLEKLRQNSHA